MVSSTRKTLLAAIAIASIFEVVTPAPVRDDCDTHCQCHADVQQTFTGTVPACVSSFSVTITSSDPGCCFNSFYSCTATQCSALVTTVINGAPGGSCRATIDTDSHGRVTGQIDANNNLEWDDLSISKDCGAIGETISLLVGTAVFAQFEVFCSSC